MSFYKHETALIHEDSRIGDGSDIGPYAMISEGAVLGAGCKVESHVVVGASSSIGDGVVLQAGSYIGPASKLGNHSSIGALASIDSRPEHPVSIGDEVKIESHVTIHGGVSIGHGAIVEAGSVVRRNVPALAVVSGFPAKIVRYVATASGEPQVLRPVRESSPTQTGVSGVTIHHLPLIEDLRGNLSFGEAAKHVPFEIQRYFLTFDVATEEVRGEHAHRELKQFIICIHGKVHMIADDGYNREEYILERPNVALFLPPMVWGVQYRFSPGAVLLVFCSAYYDPDDYIRDYAEFISLVRSKTIPG